MKTNLENLVNEIMLLNKGYANELDLFNKGDYLLSKDRMIEYVNTIISMQQYCLEKSNELAEMIKNEKERDVKSFDFLPKSEDIYFIPALTFIYEKGDEQIELVEDIMEYLGYPSEVQVLFNDNEILIAEHFSRNQRNYSVEYLSDGGMIHPKKNPLRRGATIHSQELVISILDKIGIHRGPEYYTCLGHLKFGKVNNKPVAMVRMDL